MKKTRESDSLAQCRLCGVAGHHMTEILDIHNGPNALSEKIFRCVEVRVKQSDKSTKICDICLCTVFKYHQFRRLCAATNGEMTSEDDVIVELNHHDMRNRSTNCSASSGPLVISLIDDETDSESDESHAKPVGAREIQISKLSAAKRGTISGIPGTDCRLLQREPEGIDATNYIPERDSSIETESSKGKFRTDVKKTKRRKKTKTDLVKNADNFTIRCRVSSTCKGRFESWNAMILHEKFYHSKRVKPTFSCHLCKKVVKSSHSLQRHFNVVHGISIKFMCPIHSCSKVFTTKYTLKIHTRGVHTKKNPLKCPKCSMEFHYGRHLKSHVAIEHADGVAYSCYICKRGLASKQSLQCHMNSFHTSCIRYKCSFPSCSKLFTRETHMHDHVNASHTKENVFECKMCGAKFYRQTSLRKHSLTMH